VLNTIVEVDFSQVECVLGETFFQHMRSQIRHKKGEARREIVGRVEFMRHLAEFNVFAVACDNACESSEIIWFEK
jgi:hypothetical protein